MQENRLKRVETHKFVLVIGRENQEQDSGKQAEDVAEGAGNVGGKTSCLRVGRIRGRSCLGSAACSEGGSTFGTEAALNLGAAIRTECHSTSKMGVTTLC